MPASGLVRNYTGIAQHPLAPRVVGLSRSEPLRGDDFGITCSLATTRTAALLNVNVICIIDLFPRKTTGTGRHGQFVQDTHQLDDGVKTRLVLQLLDTGGKALYDIP